MNNKRTNKDIGFKRNIVRVVVIPVYIVIMLVIIVFMSLSSDLKKPPVDDKDEPVKSQSQITDRWNRQK